MVELIKYGTKIFTEVDLNKKGTHRRIYVKALYNILLTMEGHRLFDGFGFNLPSSKKPEPIQVITEDYDAWLYNTTITNWFCPQTGELLTEYKPPQELQHLLRNGLDSERE